jgi:hypothetical protein
MRLEMAKRIDVAEISLDMMGWLWTASLYSIMGKGTSWCAVGASCVGWASSGFLSCGLGSSLLLTRSACSKGGL